MMNYSKEQLRSLQGTELMNNLYKAREFFSYKNQLDQGVQNANRELRTITNKIRKKAERKAFKWVIIIPFIIYILLLIHFYFYSFSYGPSSDLPKTGYYQEKLWLGSSRIYERGIDDAVEEFGTRAIIYLPVLLLFLPCWSLHTKIHNARRTQREIMAMKYYIEEYSAALDRLENEENKVNNYCQTDQMKFAYMVVPESFHNYYKIDGLIRVMENRCVYNLRDGIREYNQSEYEKQVLQKLNAIQKEEEKNRIESQRLQEELRYQSKIMENKARADAKANQDILRAAERNADAAQRAAKAAEEQERIAKDMEWEYWHR